MRFTSIVSAILSILTFASCTKDKQESIAFNNTLIFTAESGDNAATRTAFQSDGKSIWWCPGDAISIYYGDSEGSRFESTNSEQVARTSFRGTLNTFTGESESGDFNYFWAVYPYESAISCDGSSVVVKLSNEQVANTGSFANNTNISIAKSAGLALSFYNTCSWFRFSVAHEGIKQVIFRGNNNEVIAGEFRVSMGDDGRPTVPVVSKDTGNTSIILSASEGSVLEVGKMYYVTLLPQVFENGFTVTFKSDNLVGSRSIASRANFIRSKYNTGELFDKDVQYSEPYCPSIGEIVDSDGLGIVCWVSSDGDEYLLMSVSEIRGKNWPTSNEWCNSYGDSWRMPDIDELTLIHDSFDLINSKLSENNYQTLTTANKCYWSSTVNPNNSNYYYRERLHDGTIFTNTGSDEKSTSTANYTRAVKRITDSDIPVTIPVTSVSLDETHMTLTVGQSGHLNASVLPENATDRTINWSSSNPEIASVDATGNVSALSPGIATITAEAGGKNATCEVTVEQLINVTGVSLDKTSVAINKAEYCQLHATIVPDNATNKSVAWSSSDPSIATVDNNGRVFGVNVGSAIISVTSEDGGYDATCSVLIRDNSSPIPGTVDLGLSVLWAEKNLGAKNPENYGAYFAWGEVLPKNDYSWDTYEWGSLNSLTKYCLSSDLGIVDNLSSLELRDDAAANFKGRGWCIPSRAEIEELINDCEWEWTDSYNNTGIRGFIVRGKKDGYTQNHIFLPAGGFMPYQQSQQWLRERLLYWTRDLVQENSNNAWYLIYYPEEGVALHDDGKRLWGKSIRPVYTGNSEGWVDLTEIKIDKTSISLIEGEREELNVTIIPANATQRGVTWTSSDKSVATVTSSGIIIAKRAGSATITATLGGKSVACNVVVVLNSNPLLPEPEAVDLGLSVRWASFNLGASKPEEYGNYYAWGETETKVSYTWETYKWWKGSSYNLTKYNDSNTTVLEPEDDAAYINLGGNWRMPTLGEYQELIDKCDAQWTTENGVNGWRFTSKRYPDKSIFFPAAGTREDTTLRETGTWGDYWTSSLYLNDRQTAYYFVFKSSKVSLISDFGYRFYGCSIRPVYE